MVDQRISVASALTDIIAEKPRIPGLKVTQINMSLRRPSSELSDSDALQALAQRKENSNSVMRTLFDRHMPRLMQHLRFRFNLPESVAEDVVAQTFLRVYEKAGDFRGECEVSSWMIQIARNLAVDLVRREKRTVVLEEDAAFADDACFCELPAIDAEPQEHLAQKQLANCVRERFAAFHRRHPEAAAALWERHVNETSPQEIAPMLGRTYGATCQFLSEWNKKLRQFVAPCYEMLKGE